MSRLWTVSLVGVVCSATLFCTPREPSAAAAPAVATGVPAVAGMVAAVAPGDSGVPASGPLFEATVPAETETRLSLTRDDRKVLGWLAGAADHAGARVEIRWKGHRRVGTVGADNTFVFPFEVAEPRTATVEVPALGLKERIRLTPAKAAKSVAFFVVDRTAYRPGQTLKFAGFLRRPDKEGRFEVVAHAPVEVALEARGKKTVAARLKLRSDAAGRIEGSYTFSDADPLATYDLRIEGYEGSAELTLAEFRKAKVRLKIEPERDGDDLALSLRAVDFLDKPVAGTSVRLSAKVVRTPVAAEKRALDASRFVFADSAQSPLAPERWTKTQRLLWEAGLQPGTPAYGPVVVAERQAEVPIGDDGAGSYNLSLKKGWTLGQHSVLVEAVLTDYNGREQRASRLIPIGAEVADCELKVELSRARAAVGQPIDVTIAASGADVSVSDAKLTVVTQRLQPRTPANPYWGYGGYHYGNNLHLATGSGIYFGSRFCDRAICEPHGGYQRAWRQLPGAVDPVLREMISATSADGGKARVSFDEPGAYEVSVIAELPDGRKLNKRVGLVVSLPEDLPGLALELDSDTVDAGQMLTGTVHSRFEGAHVLLALRDGRGLQRWQTLALDPKGTRRFQLPLPQDLTWGARVEVTYLDAQARGHVADAALWVTPKPRQLDLEIAHDDVYQPGEDVTLELSAGAPAVDLVVSVYDQSLLGIAPDRSVAPSDFFLADTRVISASERERLRRMIGDVTLKELAEFANAQLESGELDPGSPETVALTQVRNVYRQHQLYVSQLAFFFQLAGVPVTLAGYSGGWYLTLDKNREKTAPVTLIELLEHTNNDWSVSWSFAGTRLLLASHHPSHAVHFQQGGQGLMANGYGLRNARGDAHFSVSGNAVFSNAGMPSGQSFISHLPATPQAIDLIGADRPGLAIRRDFSDSAVWNAGVRTDAQGKARVTFKLPDSLTNWRVVVTAVTPELRVGQADSRFRTFKPVMVWPMIPRIFTAGDSVDLYASVHNRTDAPQEIAVTLDAAGGRVVGERTQTVTVAPRSQVPVWWTFQPDAPGHAQLLMSATSEAGSDASLKRLPVSRLAAEQAVTASGFARGSFTLEVPDEADLSDAELEITVVPSLVEDMVQTLDYLVEYPYGCVEQTMSRFLPAVRVADILDRAKVRDAKLEERLPKVVAAGIKRLLDLQKPDGGWGWHGGSRTHEMMTPYALYGLLGAEKAGYELPSSDAIDKGMRRLRTFIDQTPEAQISDRLYMMYVYAHREPLTDAWWRSLERLSRSLGKMTDYALALALELSVRAGKRDLAERFGEALAIKAVRAEGLAHWRTAGFSRWGDDRYEVTAAAMKALVAWSPEHRLIPEVMSFFATTKRGNRWNSTKDTAMIIYAMADWLATQGVDATRSAREVTVGVGSLSRTVQVGPGKVARVRIDAAKLRHGSNTLRFTSDASGAMYRAVLRYWQEGKGIRSDGRGMSVQRQFWLLDDTGKRVKALASGDTVPRGAYLESEVVVSRTSGDAMSYALVENPKPASAEILPATDARFAKTSTPHALREDRTAGVAWHHETAPATITDRAVFHAELPGHFLVPPARAELMYQTTVRGHSDVFELVVGPG